MVIGIMKEIMSGEYRTSATPETVKKMIDDGHKVLVESKAGEGSFYKDADYVNAGAKIIENPQDVYDQASVILKVKEPQFNTALNKHEVDMMHEGQTLITFIHPASPVNHKMVNKLAAKGVIGLTLDGIPRISRAQSMDALSSMSTCAGYKGMLMATNDIARFIPMIGSAVGMIKPATVFVLGTGVAGLRAIATAKSLGAIVYSSDIRPEANEQAKSLGAKIIDSGVPNEIAISEDGKHAKKLSDEWIKKEKESFASVVAKSDIVFLSALLLGKRAPVLLDEEMIETMKPGSCVVDISIDQGGNCEITSPGNKIVIHGVTVNGCKNIPGKLPASSTLMFSKNIYYLLKYLVKDDKINLDLTDEITQSILVCHDGILVHEGALEAMNLI